MMNLADWAGAQDIHPQSAYRCFPQGEPSVLARRVDGLIMVRGLAGNDPRPSGKTAVYALVSSAGHKCDLNRRVARVTAWGIANRQLFRRIPGWEGHRAIRKRTPRRSAEP